MTVQISQSTGVSLGNSIEISEEKDGIIYINDNLLSNSITESNYNLLNKFMEYYNLYIANISANNYCYPYAIAMLYFN